VTIPERVNNLALISVSLKFGSRGGRGAWPVYAVYVDGRPVGSCPYREVAAILIGEGRHSVNVKISPWVSDSLELNLVGGDHAELVCDMKPLIRNRFLKIIETKFLLFAVPVAFLAMVFPDVTAFVEKHAKFEFLGIVFLTCFGGLFGMRNIYSKRPGAMLSLIVRSIQPAEGLPGDGTPSEAVANEFSRRSFR
jgi:hypothetical protein